MKTVEEKAEEYYGSDPNMYGQQRDGFIAGYNMRHGESQWVSVEERLPERAVKVLCIGTGCPYKIGAFYPEQQYFSGDDSYNGITHWQNLPQPPKNETK